MSYAYGKVNKVPQKVRQTDEIEIDQALRFCLDAAAAAAICGFNEFPPEVFGRLKFFQMQRFTFEQAKEIFYHGASLSGSRIYI